MEQKIFELLRKNKIGHAKAHYLKHELLLLFSVSGELPLTEVAKCGKCEMLGDAAPCDECYRNGNYR